MKVAASRPLWFALVAVACVLFAFRLTYWLGRGDDVAITLVLTLAQLGVVLGAFVVMARRQGSRVGHILLGWGLYTVVGGVGADRDGVLLVVWFSVQPLYWTLLAHALLTYPDGVVRGRAERWFLTVAYLMPLLWFTIAMFSAPGWLIACGASGCPGNPVLVTPDAGLVNGLWRVNAVLAAFLGVWFVGLVVLRRRAMTPARLRRARPVLWATAALAAGYLAHTGIDLAQVSGAPWRAGVLWAGRVATFCVPAALLVGLLATKLARAEVATLLLRLRSADELAPALAELLRDPTLAIVTTPAGAGGRAVTDLGGGWYLLHHPDTRAEDPALFDAGVTAVRMTLDNHRLTEQVRAQLIEVTASRERLVRAADDERRRVERDLHDGAQQQLLGLGMALRAARLTVADATDTASILDDAAAQLRSSLADLRDLARGLRPALLTERGLPAALADLRRRAAVPVTLRVDVPVRPSADTETTAYFVVAEALQNVARHAPTATATVTVGLDGSRLLVAVSDDGPGGADERLGSGLRGLADRVAAAGGRLSVHSDPGAGTRVFADLPAQGDP